MTRVRLFWIAVAVVGLGFVFSLLPSCDDWAARLGQRAYEIDSQRH